MGGKGRDDGTVALAGEGDGGGGNGDGGAGLGDGDGVGEGGEEGVVIPTNSGPASEGRVDL